MKLFPFGRQSRSITLPPAAPDAAPVKLKKRSWFGSPLAGMFKSSAVKESDRWASIPIPPDMFISLRQPVLVARSREQWSNNDYVRAFIRMVRQNVVGDCGITMQSRVTKARGGQDKDVNNAIEAWWEDWGRSGNCDVTGTLTWREIQALAIETTARDGEFIVRLVYGNDAGPHGFALQMIDPQRLMVQYDNPHYDKAGSFIRHGIEFNRYGKPTAYHFSSTDEWDANYYAISGRGFVRVPADEIIHKFVKELVGQRRGLPWASTSLLRLHHLDGFEDAAVQNARAGASKMGFITWKEGFGPECDDDTDVAGSIEGGPLHFHELPEGAEFKEFNPNYPNGEIAPFTKIMLRSAASGMGVAYNGIANDLEHVNYSSIRDGSIRERDGWKEHQQWLIAALCEPVREAWLKLQLLKGSIKVKGRALTPERLVQYRACTWQPRRWAWVDPRADVDAALNSIRGGLNSISQVIREQGRDPEQVFQEIADDVAAMKAAGIDDDTIKFFLLGAPVPPPPEAANENKPTKDAA